MHYFGKHVGNFLQVDVYGKKNWTCNLLLYINQLSSKKLWKTTQYMTKRIPRYFVALPQLTTSLGNFLNLSGSRQKTAKTAKTAQSSLPRTGKVWSRHENAITANKKKEKRLMPGHWLLVMLKCTNLPGMCSLLSAP